MFAISNDTNRFLTDSFNNRRKSTASRKAVSMPIEMATSGTPIRRDSPTAVLPKRPNGSPTPKIGAIGSQVLKIDDAKLATTMERFVLHRGSCSEASGGNKSDGNSKS